MSPARTSISPTGSNGLSLSHLLFSWNSRCKSDAYWIFILIVFCAFSTIVETLRINVSVANRGGEGYTNMNTKKQLPGSLVKTFRQLVYFSSSVMKTNLHQLCYWNNAVGNICIMMFWFLTAHKSCFRSVLSSECMWELVYYNTVYTFVSDFCGRKVNTFFTIQPNYS